MRKHAIVTIIVCLSITLAAFAEDSADKLTDLAKETQNPVAAMISLPLQGNVNFNSGPEKNIQSVLNIQPVIPLPLTKEWNLINRIVLPVIDNPQPADVFGLGDVNISLFLSPASKTGFVWGAGPVIQAPSATSTILSAGKWAAGPTAVAVFMEGPVVLGAMANNRWSFAGDGSRSSYNQMLLQPFLNYNLPDGWSLGTAPIMTADWTASSGEQWTIPVGGTISKVFKVGSQMMSIAGGGYYNAVRPTDSSDWTLRLVLSFLFPE